MKKNKQLSHGAYSILMTILIAFIIIMINLIFGKIPATVSKIDYSSAKLYTLTEVSESFLSDLHDPVTFYYICEGGLEDPVITTLLERYQDASPMISVEQIDPVLYPGFTSKYETDRIENNSLIIVSGDKHKTVRSEDFYATEYSMQRNGYVQGAFDGEGQITSAIDYVTTNRLPVFYIVTGNDEKELPDSYKNELLKNNIELKELQLLTAEEVPQDAAALILTTPANDYTEAEAEVILKYLENGGKALIFSDYAPQPPIHFLSVLQNYGLEQKPGIILEGDSNHFISYPYCILPDVQYTEITADIYGKKYALLPMAQGIKVMESHRDSISYQPLLITSMSSYSKVDVQNMTTSEKEDGDLNGPFPVGMLVQEDIDQNHTYDTELIYFTSGYLLDADYNSAVSGGNAELISSSAAYFAKGAGASRISIPPKSLQVPYLTMSSFTANLLSIITVFVIPLFFILTGFVIWFRRRRK